MPPEAMCEVTLVRIADGERRLNHAHSRPQQLACSPHPNALQVSMRGQSDDLREGPRQVKGAARSERSQLRQGDVVAKVCFQVFLNTAYGDALVATRTRLTAYLRMPLQDALHRREQP